MFNLIRKLTERFLPNWISHLLLSRLDGTKRYLFNTGWTALGRVVSFCVSFFTVALVAQYLGPENYGKLSYAQSFVAIFSVFASLGIDHVIYRNLIAEPEHENAWIGTAIAAKTILGLFTFVATIATAVLLTDEPLLTWLIGIIAISFIIQPVGIVGHLFNAKVKAQYSTLSTILVSVLIPILKVGTIFISGGVLYFAAIVTTEALLYSVINLWIYLTAFRRSPKNWRVTSQATRSLLQNSWPLAAASLSGYIYGRIDQVMIQHFIDAKAVGLYDVAVRITELLGFLPSAIISSLLPAVVGLKQHNQSEYQKRWLALSLLCLGITGALATTIFVIAPYVVSIFGSEFTGSTNLLRVYVWSIIGTIAIVLLQQYLIAEKQTSTFLILSLIGSITNVGLNFVFIPYFGAVGAAFATLLTLTAMVSIFILIKLRRTKPRI